MTLRPLRYKASHEVTMPDGKDDDSYKRELRATQIELVKCSAS